MHWAPFEIERHTLANGLRIVLYPDRSLPLVTINLWYHVGSKNERPGRTGFAHLFEHMLFQGSEHVPENGHFRYVQQVGGVTNGSTWYDRTSYYETLPAQHTELGLWLESDRMGFLLPALTEENLEKQRRVVSNERRQRVENRPYGLALERLFEKLYPEDHPYHWPVIGYMDDIASATHGEVREFFTTYYTPNNAVLTLVGDFEPASIVEMVKRYFEPIPRGPEIRAVEAGLPIASDTRREVLPDAVQLSRVYVAYATPAYGTEPWYATDLLSVVLAKGKASRLYQDLVYRCRMAHSVECFLTSTEECATLILVATANQQTDPRDLEEKLLAHMARLEEEPISAAEMERARNLRLTAYYKELQSQQRKAELLSQFTTFFDHPERLGQERVMYNQLHAEDLQRVACQFCRAEQGTTVVVVPR